MPERILVVDDDPVQRRLLEAALTRAGHAVSTAESGEAALAAIEADDGSIAAMVLDLIMPGMSGLDVLDRLGADDRHVPVIVQTAQGGIDTVVRAMRHGAFDFVVKPVSPERIAAAVAAALKLRHRKSEEAARPARARPPRAAFSDIVTSGAVMERALGLARRASSSGIPILLEGESGVGKELVARAIQSGSERRSKPFVTVNCGAIPENLVESILFGHEKGSFTGATEKHVGKFAEADGGTLFLDEVGDLPPEAQVKLLRAIQEGEVDPVGGRATRKVDIRLISATNRDLIELVKEGRFREDLYYRLNVFPIHIPPLRERREDIALLVQHFIGRISKAETGGRVRGITGKAMAVLAAHDWPGNVRELENAVFRAVVLCDDDMLSLTHFPQIAAQSDGFCLPAGSGPVAVASLPPQSGPDSRAGERDAAGAGMLRATDGRGNVRPLAEIETEMIRFAIDHYDGKMSEVARRLGIGRSTLYRKLRELGIEADGPDAKRLENVSG